MVLVAGTAGVRRATGATAAPTLASGTGCADGNGNAAAVFDGARDAPALAACGLAEPLGTSRSPAVSAAATPPEKRRP
jgi:hypothetical protein